MRTSLILEYVEKCSHLVPYHRIDKELAMTEEFDEKHPARGCSFN